MMLLNQTRQKLQWQSLVIGIAFTAMLTTAGLSINVNHNGDFEGSGTMNPTVYNESTGEWLTLTGRNNYKPESLFWGGPGWTAIQSDYDGDGIADIVAYNRSSGEWAALLSSNGYQIPIYITFGGEGWTPVTGVDYDGDNLTDPTIYCEATGEWVTKRSKSDYQPTSIIFGGPGYTAVSGDYDGDGLSDPAICQTSTGQWLVLLSSRHYATASFYVDTMGDAGPLVPVPADYDGDRKTDPAIFAYEATSWQNKDNVFGWHLLYSSKNYQQIAPFYGVGRDDPQYLLPDPEPGDYDGDGRTDYGMSWYDSILWRMWLSRNNYATYDGDDWGKVGFHPVQR